MTRDTVETVRVFSTAGVPAEDRIDLWQAHNSAALMSLRCHALTDAQFGGTTRQESVSAKVAMSF